MKLTTYLLLANSLFISLRSLSAIVSSDPNAHGQCQESIKAIGHDCTIRKSQTEAARVSGAVKSPQNQIIRVHFTCYWKQYKM